VSLRERVSYVKVVGIVLVVVAVGYVQQEWAAWRDKRRNKK